MKSASHRKISYFLLQHKKWEKFRFLRDLFKPEKVMTETGNVKVEEVVPMISKLLAGSSKNKRPYPIEVVESHLPEDPEEESGILEIAYTEDSLEDTTSPEDPSAPKSKRTARKCKWYVQHDTGW